MRLTAQNGQPRQGVYPAGAVVLLLTAITRQSEPSSFGKRTRKPNSVYAVIPLGAALPRALVSDLPGGSGHCLTPLRRRPVAGGPAGAAFRRRAGAVREPCSGSAHPSLFGLAPCGVYHASAITAGAVRSYRTFSPLPRRDWPSRRTCRALPEALQPESRGVAEAVCFLWHWPSTGLYARVPDVIRHTALRSSDFPLPATPACTRISGSDRPVLLPVSSVPRIRIYQLR